ncbi:MAG TPA: tetratricopeptide repeat protein [Nannocystaceae bacterium]|nr:tetratricopeptide repeat protein [Nannocystaceae bacterium]
MSARAMASGRVAMDARARLDISDVLDDLGHPRAAASWATIAYELATAAGDDRTAALAAFATLSLASVLREDDRATWRRHSDAALARVDDPALTAEYWRAVSWAAAAERRADEAEEALRRAIAVSDSVDQPLARVGDLLDLGETMLIRHRYAEALALHREAYELAAQVAGPRHPIALRVRGELANSLLFVDAEAARRELDVLLVEVPAVLGEESSAYAAVLARYGTLELRANELDAGIAHIERSTEIFARIHGPWSSAQAANRYQLGYAHLVRGDSVRAEVELREALAIQERVDSDGPAIVQPAIALASIASDRQDWKTAIALMRRALSVLGDDPSDGRIAEVLYQLAAAELDSGDFEAARTTVARALPITAASFGTPSNRMAELRALVADLHEHDGDVVAAIAEYREVEAMMLASPPMRWRGIGFARGRLAELQWKAGDRREARAMAGAAIQAYEQAEGTAEAIAVLRTWLAEHPLRR